MAHHDKSAKQQKAHLDPGAFIGRGDELASESIPRGVQRNDERVAGVATQSTGAGGRGDVPEEERRWPEGPREGPPADDDAVREAGQNR